MENEKRLRLAQRVAGIGSWEYNIRTKKLWGSEECFRIYGVPLNEGVISFDQIDAPPEEKLLARKALADLIEKGIAYNLEHTIFRKGSSDPVILHSTAELIRGDDGVLKVVGIIQDITKRKHLEEAQRLSEEKYRDLIDKMPDGFYKSTHEGKFIDINPAMVKILGYGSKEELLAIDIKSQLYFSEKDRESAAIEEKFNEMSIFRLKKKDGSEIWVEDNGRHILDEKGNVLYHEGILRDVTMRTRAEEALHKSEEKYRMLVEKMPDGVYKSTHEGKFLEVNPAMVRILGYDSKEELLAIDIKKQLYFAEEERESAALEEKHSEMAVFRLRKKDGSEIWVEDNGRQVLDDQGNVLYHDGILRDVTERKQAEQALLQSEKLLRESQNVAHLGSYVIHLKSGLWIRSKILNDILGINETYDPSLEGLLSLIHPDFVKHVSNQLDECIAKKRRFDLEYKIIRKNEGTERWVHSLGDFEFDTQYNVVRIFGTIQDITEAKKLEERLIQSQKLEGLGTLAGGIAHDFNNLLAILLGNAELLKLNVAHDPKLKNYVDHIIDVANRGASISKQLLLFSRQSDVNLKPISLSKLIDEVITMLRHFIPKTIEIVSDIQVENGLINGDAGHIHQVLLNLCLNAKDAMGETGTLRIAERTVDADVIRDKFSKEAEGQYVSISIHDTGSGIETDIVQKIFDPFFTTKEKGKGSGLGLSIVDGLVRSHSGFIDVQSEKGSGAVFTLYFPVVSNLAVEESPQIESRLTTNKIFLVVDDEADIREILKEFLEGSGGKVRLASDGFEALDIYTKEKENIDVVITDLGMPRMSGEELSRRLKQVNPNVKVIVASGYLDRAMRESIIMSGVHDIINKPFKFSELSEILKKIQED